MSNTVAQILATLRIAISALDRIQLAATFNGDFQIAQITLDCYKYRLSQWSSSFLRSDMVLATIVGQMETIESILPELIDSLDLSARTELYKKKAKDTVLASRPPPKNVLHRMARRLHLFLCDFSRHHQQQSDCIVPMDQPPWHIFTQGQLDVELESIVECIAALENVHSHKHKDEFISSLVFASVNNISCCKDVDILKLVINNAVHNDCQFSQYNGDQQNRSSRLKPYWSICDELFE